MAFSILTPVTLWKDFDDALPLCEEIVGETQEDGITVRDVCFYGRQVGEERVKIYARYSFPAGAARFPVVMVLFEAGMAFDERFVQRFLSSGYGVLCVDYCGENGRELHTRYPAAIDYANYVRAGEHVTRANPTARETSWYEWAAVARYAARYLASREEVTAAGAIGMRTGGEVLFKIAPYAPLRCMISVCAAGWLAYQNMERYSDDAKRAFDEERYRYIAGIDSQSYAPYVKCPVLLLSAVNDVKYDHDRVYDTFRMLNPEIEKAILFSAHGNGLIGTHSVRNVDLFLDKYLKGRSVFISKPISIEAKEDGEGNLVVEVKGDKAGEIADCGIFYTEKVTGSKTRDWTRVLCEPKNGENVFTVPLGLYTESKRALVYGFVKYSNGFSVTSNIKEIVLEKQYKNSCLKSRVIYNNADGYNGFVGLRQSAQAVADCFMPDSSSNVKVEAGYGGIKGITSSAGIVSFRVGEPRYGAPEGVSFRFDAYAKQNARLKITFYLDANEEQGYCAEVNVEGGGKWKSFFLDPFDFKAANGASLNDFTHAVSVAFYSEREVLVNNVLWI